jgi:hypothetical protein
MYLFCLSLVSYEILLYIMYLFIYCGLFNDAVGSLYSVK